MGVSPPPSDFFTALEAANMSGQDWDMRPHLLDKNTNSYVLLDSGAAVSAYPPDPGDQVDPSVVLKAVNGTKLKCYGYKDVDIKIGRKTYAIQVVKTDVSSPVLGWNFTRKHRLTMDWSEFGDALLIDKRNGISSVLKYKAISHSRPQRLAKLDANPLPEKSSHQVFFEVSAMEALEKATSEVINDLEAMPESKFKDLVAKFPDLLKLKFDLDDDKPKNGVIHRILTGSNPPCRAKVRRLLPGTEKYEKGYEAIKNLEKLGIIERVDPGQANNWSSALHFAVKEGGALRPVGDYRLLNQKTILDLYPLPELKSFTSQIAGSRIFSKVDLAKAFHQILIDKRDRHKTAITTQWGMFNFRRLSMGLQNSAQSFQRLVDTALKDVPNTFCYLDDILVFNDSEESHLQTLNEVFKRLDKFGLSLNLAKCEFGKSSLNYLGFTVDSSGIRPIEKKVSALKDFPTPSSQKQLLAFLGALNYYRSSLPSLDPVDSQSKPRTPAEILDPLYKLATCEIKKDKFSQIWENSTIVKQAFKNAKSLLDQAVTLNFPDPKAPLALTTDASKIALGASLDQFIDGSWKPLGLWSKTLKGPQRTYSTFKRELMAVRLAMRHFNKDFAGRHLVVFTDHRPLVCSFQSPDLQAHDPQALNAINEIAQFTSDIRYKPGKLIPIADWLSRPDSCPIGTSYALNRNEEMTDFEETALPNVYKQTKIDLPVHAASTASSDDSFFPSYVSPEETLAGLEEVALHTLNPQSIAEAQASCPDVNAHLQGNMPKNVKIGHVDFSGFKLVCETSDKSNPRPMLPASLRSLVLNLLHHSDHAGVKETTRRAATEYYWPGLRKDAKSFARTCHPCQLAKQAAAVNPGVGNFPVPDKRFSYIHLDIVGPLPASENKKYILTIFDRCSRWTECYPLERGSSDEVCKGFLSWVSHYGLPAVAVSDNGNAFVSNLFKDLLSTFSVKVNFTPAYHAASNGAIERKHQDIKNALKASLVAMGNKHRDKWMQALPWVMLGRRTSFQPNLDASAAQMVLGMSPKLPGQVLGHPGPPLNNLQLKVLLDQLYKMADRPPVPTTAKREELDISETLKATHVYVKEDCPQSLCPLWDGPFPIYSRPSRSQVEVKLGVFKDGRPRLLNLHWSSCKIANLRDDAEIGQRPMLGRRRKCPHQAVSHTLTDEESSAVQPAPTNPVSPVQRGSESDKRNQLASSEEAGRVGKQTDSAAKIQTSKPTRSSRNPRPTYVF